MDSFTKEFKHYEKGLAFHCSSGRPRFAWAKTTAWFPSQSRQTQAMMVRGVTLCSVTIKWPCYYSVA
jgi:hypothetical protein